MKLIRDILKDKSAAEPVARQAGSAEMQPAAESPSTSPDEQGLSLDPYLLKPASDAPKADSFDDMDDELAAIEAAGGGSHGQHSSSSTSQSVSYWDDEDDADYDNEDVNYDDEVEKLDAFDQAAFMNSLKEDGQDEAADMPDPFAKLSGSVEPTSQRQASPSPLKRQAAPAPKAAEPAPTAATEPSVAPAAPAAPAPQKQASATPPVAEGPDSEIGGLEDLAPLADATDLSAINIPAPAAGRGSNRSGRVKTRLLGFSGGVAEQDDPFAKAAQGTGGKFPVGWVAVVSEMGRGSAFPLFDGVSKVGRGTDQTVSLNFGDNSISRENHVSIAYDAEQNKFFIGHSGKSNLVRINGKPLLSTEELHSKDLIRLGETTLRFMAFCEDDFNWNAPSDTASSHV